jgi:hypothetical protein
VKGLRNGVRGNRIATIRPEEAEMLGRDRTDSGPRVVAFDARGGVSPGAILTGVVVAFGATFVFSAIVGGVLVALGISNSPSSVVTAGVGAGIALIVAQLLAYLWGGYAAGRMARGAGLANGLLVPLAAILVAVAVGAIVTALGATANLNLPSITHFNPRLPISSNQLNNRVLDTGLWIALGALLAMFVGGAIGGLLGARWHTKLERQTLADRTDTTVESGEGVTALQTDRTVETNGADDDDGTQVIDRPDDADRTIETNGTVATDSTSDDSGAVSAYPTPATTGGAAGAGSEYPRANPTVADDSEPGTTTTTSGDSRA